MKKLLLSVAIVATALSVNAQKFKVGLGGAFNSTWLMNKNVFDADDKLDIAMTFGGSFGLKTQYYFNDKLGLELGIMRTGHNQKYEGTISNSSYSTKLKLRYLDVPLLLRVGGDKGAYFEFGPQFSFLSTAKEDRNASGSGYKNKDVKNSLNATNIGVLIGFGADVDLSESITLTAGLRIGYGFTDVTKEKTFSVDDAWATSWANRNKGFNEPSYKSTNRLFGGINLGILYTIPTGK
ncbi:MAG: PorT family protein [Bacteroidetes bacterium]|nr:PorT family protein [Bacteroidota bacterium]